VSPRRRLTLESLDALDYSVDLDRRADWTQAAGWIVDDYVQPLPPEQPGEPEAGGPFEAAVTVVERYEFADPDLVRGTWDPEAALEGRSMLLEARYLGLRLRIGTRVYRVVDELRRDADGTDVRAWGWGYATLAGHFEMGTMDYEVGKRLADGAVDFRIHVVSRHAAIRNPLVRVGFRLVGRRLQQRFARNACARVAELVAERTGRGSARPAQAVEPR
jgi:uncharacterized protein (UPF0548 family)